jgi:cytochrome c peroxidase
MVRAAIVLAAVLAVAAMPVPSGPGRGTPTPYVFPALKHFPPMPVSPTNPVSVEGAALGRYLFYDPILSRDRTLSCASCHRQSAAFSDGPKAFSTGADGTAMRRNTMPLFNLAWYPAFFWDGKAMSLEEQVFHPVRAHDEMDLDWPTAEARIRASAFYQDRFNSAFGEVLIDSVLIARAIAQFERTLLSDGSRYDRAIRRELALTAEEREGFALMNDQTKGNCLHCHTTERDALTTTATFSNNGLTAAIGPDDHVDKGLGAITGRAADNGLFRIPSLRNIAVTAPYMHDGRFATLEDVLDFYAGGPKPSANLDPKMGAPHPGTQRLTAVEKERIIHFLYTLTDSAFLTDPAFSDPFIGAR